MENLVKTINEAKEFIIENVGSHLEWKLIRVKNGYIYYTASTNNSICSLEIPVMGNTFHSMMDNEDLDNVLSQGSTLFLRNMDKYSDGIKFIIIANKY